MFNAAKKFLKELKERELNVVTAESLTSGLINATLVDVPLFGSYIYGGFATYDSDAKRKFIGVREGDVYTKETALEIAAGSLLNSRALVSIAVTGKAGPVEKNDLDTLGVVDVAVSIKTTKSSTPENIPTLGEMPQTYTTLHKRINLCGKDGHKKTRKFCEMYHAEALSSEQGFVSEETLTTTRKLIRQDTVIGALKLAKSHIEQYKCKKINGSVVCPKIEKLDVEDYDQFYISYGEPSWVIKNHLNQ